MAPAGREVVGPGSDAGLVAVVGHVSRHRRRKRVSSFSPWRLTAASIDLDAA